ncbi:hypothetical protein EON65_18620 [archaeon]|nr:MAG: hypothetical protein EON65_18620 [archaeon]
MQSAWNRREGRNAHDSNYHPFSIHFVALSQLTLLAYSLFEMDLDLFDSFHDTSGVSVAELAPGVQSRKRAAPENTYTTEHDGKSLENASKVGSFLV